MTQEEKDQLNSVKPYARLILLRELVGRHGAEMLPNIREFLRTSRPRKVAREAFWQMLRLGPKAEAMANEMFLSPNWTERKAATCLLRRWGKLTGEQYEKARYDKQLAVRFCPDQNPRYGINLENKC